MIQRIRRIAAILFVFSNIIFTSAYSQQEHIFTLQVQNEAQKPLHSASVTVLNSDAGGITNESGEIVIKELSYGDYTFQISAEGYASSIKHINFTAAHNKIVIQLKQATHQLDEVVVTAEKKEERLQQLPFSVSALNAKDVQSYKLWNIKDITAIVPNLYSASPGDYRNVTSIRGITTTSYDPAVATYIDGVNQFGLDTYIAQLLDIERIEVLRGPQGTLYGRNTTGGVISIITKKPTNVTKMIAEINAGNLGLQRYNAGISFPVIKDKLFFGASGLYEHKNGYFTNIYTNTRFDKQHTLMGNYYLRFQPGKKFSVTLNAKHYLNDNNGPFPLAISSDEALSHDYEVNQNATTTMKDKTFNTSLNINYSGQHFNFTSLSSYQSNYRFYTNPIDGDFSAADAVSIVNNYGDKWNKIRVGTQEFRFTSPAASTSPFKWVAGLYGFYQYNPVRQGTHFGEDAGLIGSPIINFTSINMNTGRSSGIAGYGQGTYSISNKLDLTLGARYDYEHKKQLVKGEFQMDGTEAITTRPDTSATANFKAFSPKASLSFHSNDNHQWYISYSKGFRAGGLSALSSDPSQPPLFAYKPEHSNNYEAGVKNVFWNNQMRLNVAFFYTTITDAQVPTLILPDAITLIQNAGKLDSKGFDVELAAKLLRSLEVNYNFGYTDATFTSLTLASNGEALKLDNNRQVYTPKYTSSLTAQYGYKIGANSQIVAIGEWHMVGKQYFDLANNISQNAFSLLNAQVGLSISKYAVYLWGKNLSDKKYIDYAYDFGAAHLGNPLTYGITARINISYSN